MVSSPKHLLLFSFYMASKPRLFPWPSYMFFFLSLPFFSFIWSSPLLPLLSIIFLFFYWPGKLHLYSLGLDLYFSFFLYFSCHSLSLLCFSFTFPGSHTYNPLTSTSASVSSAFYSHENFFFLSWVSPKMLLVESKCNNKKNENKKTPKKREERGK